MASVICDQCGTRVAADEQFCPTCGAFIDPMEGHGTPARRGVITVKSDGGEYEEFQLGTPPSARQAGEGVTCPSCGTVNPGTNRHCEECGARLSQGPLPTAPRPAVQATAGVRAAFALSALLFGVVVVALVFTLFNDDTGAAETTVTAEENTTLAIAELGPIDILGVECTPDGIGSFVCDNLVSGSNAEYQITWEELAEGENVTIRLTFRQRMIVHRIDWSNISDETRFRQNYRTRGIIIDAENAVTSFTKELLDQPGTQTIDYAAVDANWIEITVESAYQAEVTAGNVFRELAIDEIVVIGRPSNLSVTTTTG